MIISILDMHFLTTKSLIEYTILSKTKLREINKYYRIKLV